jgi:pimeloyl-ACP methyl ester carboxylesterase
MPEVSSRGARISYDVVGEGRPLMLLHGWCCDRSWWIEPGYVGELSRDHRLVLVGIRGHGASDTPHEAAAYTADAVTGDVFAVADAEGLDPFAIWGQSYGGWVAWMTAAAAPQRVPAIVTSGSWDPRPPAEEPTGRTSGSRSAARRDACAGRPLRGRGRSSVRPRVPSLGAHRHPQSRSGRAARRAAHELWDEGISDGDLRSFPVPALLIAGALEDAGDDAAKVAALIPNGQSLRLPGLGHGGACAASALAVPTARAFLDRWFP